MTVRIVLIHGFDPRGRKVGGMETHVRQILRRYPADMRPLLVGIDDAGDLELGKCHRVVAEGRELDFFPVAHVGSGEQTIAAASVSDSVTFRFAKAVMRHLPALRRLIRGETAVAEVERFELAPLAWLLGCPTVVMAHNEGDPRSDKMDSVLARHWYVHTLAEWLAFRIAKRIFCVTPRLLDRIRERHPSQVKKGDVLTVSVDTELFYSAPFDLGDGKLKLVYAGRLDEFKNPPLMFKVARRLHERLGGAFEFHYCGGADPHRFEEFAAIEPFTVRHNALLPPGVAEVMRSVHMGILVSYWEGMPCFLLELLASGRPFGGLRLPQFDQVVEPGVNGRMAERQADEEATELAVVEAILGQWDDIRGGRVDPEQVRKKIMPFSVDNQLGRLFDAMRQIARPN